MPEQIVFDPSELASGRSEIDITPWLTSEGIDWGDAEIAAYSVEGMRGDIPVDYRVPTRVISGGLQFKGTVGGTTVTQARTAISSKIALWQREGGWLKRITASGGTVFAEITNATFRASSASGWQSAKGIDLGASFTLEAVPDFFENEVTDSDNSTTSLRELIFNTTGLSGDNPARVRTVVDNDGSTDWRGLIWAYRSRHFSSAVTAKVAYGAEELQNLDTATKVALAGAHGGTVVTHGTLSTSWTPVVGTNIGGTSYLTHTGTYRLWARVYTTSGTAVQSRFVYDVGDLVNPEENASFRVPGGDNYYIVDYGEVRIEPSKQGAHRWQGVIQAKGDSGGENLSVDRVWFQNTDEAAGVLSVPLSAPEGLASFSARSNFSTESGTITGDALAVGGNWTVVTNSDTDDFSASGGVATRTSTSDTGTMGVGAGRTLTAGTAVATGIAVQVDLKTSLLTSAVLHGVTARSVDANNGLIARFSSPGAGAGIVYLAAIVSSSVVKSRASAVFPASADTWYTLRLLAATDGLAAAYFGPRGGPLTLVSSLTDPVLATGGALDDGRFGIYDTCGVSTAVTRTYDNFAAWVPSLDAAAFASRSAQLGSDAIIRHDSGGTAYGELVPSGDLPRFPVPASTSGTVETLLVPTTGDLETLPDTMGTASVSARNYRRPSWLFVDDA